MKALVVGGTKGFGQEVAKKLIERNFSLVTVGRSDADYNCDIGDLEKWKEVLIEIKKEHKVLDVVFFIVGYARAKSSKDLTDKDWNEHLGRNLIYVALGLEHLKNNFSGGAKIITTGSQWSYKVGNDELVAYTISKHALGALTLDFASRNQLVIANHYCVPTMATPQYYKLSESYAEIRKDFPSTEPSNSDTIAKKLVEHVLNFRKSGATIVIDEAGKVKEL